jgi:U3 small nucleolar RNA-associated protein 3
MFKRDQIMFNPQDESDDALSDDGEEVLSLNKPLSRRKSAAAAAEKDLEEDYSDEDDDEGEYDQVVSRKMRKEKLKPDLSTRGRFGKAADSDEEDLDLDLSDEDIQGEDEDEEDEEEGWGRQYYSRPSTRREKEVEGEYDEKREEERELEEKEVRRLQKKAAEGMTADDWGVDGDTATTAVEVSGIDKTLGGKGGADEDEDEVFSSTKTAAVPTPQTTDPAVLIRHMESNEPVKLALAREWPHVVKKLEKTARGIRKLEAEKEGQLHKGLGWLHYRESGRVDSSRVEVWYRYQLVPGQGFVRSEAAARKRCSNSTPSSASKSQLLTCQKSTSNSSMSWFRRSHFIALMFNPR